MSIPEEHDRVWWWNLDRDGMPVHPDSQPERETPAPALEDGSPYVPTFYVDVGAKIVPGPHLHQLNGRIVGIHARGRLEGLRQVLARCVDHEVEIIERFGHLHFFDIPLEPVLHWLKNR